MRFRRLVTAVALTAMAACADRERLEKGTTLAPSSSTSTVSAPPSASGAPSTVIDGKHVYVNPARRCAECHGRIQEQWAGSAHARGASSEPYAALRALAKSDACDACHAPLDRELPPGHAAAGEGVTCDACHTVQDVTVTKTGATTSRTLEDNVRYGTLEGAANHYFHRMGFAPLYGEARYCAACHHGAHSLPGKSAVFSEYDEWTAGPMAPQGVPCQNCHMPGDRGEAATGAGLREHVPHHGLLGRDGELRRRALRSRAVVQRTSTGVAVTVSLQNVRAGHTMPTGVPERRVVVEARSLDATGVVVDSATVSYGRHLVDARGRPAPFFAAEREEKDDRIRPRESRVKRFVLGSRDDGAVVVRLLFAPLAADVAASLGLAAPEPEVLAEARVAVGSIGRGDSRVVEMSK